MWQFHTPDSHFKYRDMRDKVKSSAPRYTQLGPQRGSVNRCLEMPPSRAGRLPQDARSRLGQTVKDQ